MGSRPGPVCDIRLNTALSAAQRVVFQDGATIRRLLSEARTIAVVGMSSEPTKASNMVASYLQDEGYRIVPVNPRGGVMRGEAAFPDLASIPFPVDLAVVFRPPGEVAHIVDQAVASKVEAIWLQLRIIDLEGAARARAAGLAVIVDRCIKMEHGRYSGALHWAGMNTEVVTAQRRRFR